MIMTRDKNFYRTFLFLFLPLMMQDVINLAVNLADNLMLGYDQATLSGATAVNMIQFILQCLVGGVGSGISVLGSQYWGQRRIEPIKRLIAFGFLIAVGFSLVITAVCTIAPHQVIWLFTEEEPYIQEGMKYLAPLKYSYIIYAISTILIFALNSVEAVKLSFWVSIETLIVNIGLNLWLIPLYGSYGAGLATLAARAGSLIVVFVYIAFFDKRLQLKWKDLFTYDKVLCRDYVKVATPVVIISALWGFNNGLQTSILGHVNQYTLAANSASSTLYSLFKASSQSACNASGIIMAKTVGGGSMKQVKEYTKTFQVIFILIGLISACLLFVTKDFIFSIYKLSEESMRLAHQFVLVMCVCMVGMSYQMPTTAGLIRGGGDTKFGMYNDLISIWGIVLPISALAAFVWKWPPVAVVCCLNADQVFKCGAAAIRCNSYKWVKKLTRDEKELTHTA